MMGNGTEKRRSENPDKLLSSVGPESTPRDGTSSHRGGGGGGGGVAGGGSAGSTASSPAVTMLSSSASTPALSYSLGVYLNVIIFIRSLLS